MPSLIPTNESPHLFDVRSNRSRVAHLKSAKGDEASGDDGRAFLREGAAALYAVSCGASAEAEPRGIRR